MGWQEYLSLTGGLPINLFGSNMDESPLSPASAQLLTGLAGSGQLQPVMPDYPMLVEDVREESPGEVLHQPIARRNTMLSLDAVFSPRQFNRDSFTPPNARVVYHLDASVLVPETPSPVRSEGVSATPSPSSVERVTRSAFHRCVRRRLHV